MPLKFLSRSVANTPGQPMPGYAGKSITDVISNGFITVDDRWTVIYWNAAAERLLGIQSKDILGQNLWEKLCDILPINFYAYYHRAFQPDVPIHFQEYWEEMDAWFNVVTYYSENTLSVSFKSSSQPVHPHYTETQLRTLNELYRYVTEVTNDCLWEWNFQAREIFWIDGGHKRVFGYDVENALIPQSLWESRLHPADRLRVLTRLGKILSAADTNIWEEEYRFAKVNGEYAYVQDRAHIIYAAGRAVRMIGATQDVSVRKVAELVLSSGLELIEGKKSLLVQKIKNIVIELAHYSEEPMSIKFSEYLSQKLNHDYTYLANLFSEDQGITIEKFLISNKIERVKELLVYDELNLTEIAYQMHYSSVAHLSTQFKKVTGLTPSHFKNLRKKRHSLLRNV